MCLPFLAPLGAAMGASAASAAAVGTMTAISAVGTGLSVYSSFKQAEAQQDAANYNAKVAEYAAIDAQQRGEQEAMKVRQQGDQLRATQRATMAARGLDLGSGTPMSLLDQTDFFSEADQMTVRNNAAKEAWAKRAQATGYRNEANSINPMLAGTSTLLTGAGSVASQWYGRSSNTGSKVSWG